MLAFKLKNMKNGAIFIFLGRHQLISFLGFFGELWNIFISFKGREDGDNLEQGIFHLLFWMGVINGKFYMQTGTTSHN
jgi:hypothetical protein